MEANGQGHILSKQKGIISAVVTPRNPKGLPSESYLFLERLSQFIPDPTSLMIRFPSPLAPKEFGRGFITSERSGSLSPTLLFKLDLWVFDS